MNQTKTIDILSVGELLVDMMSTEYANQLEDIQFFRRLPGGSPANLCMNMSRLGNTSHLVSSVGADAMGNFLIKYLKLLGVDTNAVRQVKFPTTLILLTRSKEVASFEVYRGADCHIAPVQFPTALLSDISIFHTTCFALSREPARSNILQAAEVAARYSTQLSIDANFSEKVWDNRTTGQEILRQYCSMGALVKISEVDWQRLYPDTPPAPSVILNHFLAWGAKNVCLTLGGEGCWVASATDAPEFLPSRPVDVKDTTGAGDAFWSGYLTAWLDGYAPILCATAGRKMAELKIAHAGPLPEKVNKQEIFADFPNGQKQ